MMSTPTFRYSAASRGVIQTAFFGVGSAAFIRNLLAPKVRCELARVCCETDTVDAERCWCVRSRAHARREWDVDTDHAGLKSVVDGGRGCIVTRTKQTARRGWRTVISSYI